jgi:hypothetical protein
MPMVFSLLLLSDKGTGKKQDITITGASTLPKDEVCYFASAPLLPIIVMGIGGEGVVCYGFLMVTM